MRVTNRGQVRLPGRVRAFGGADRGSAVVVFAILAPLLIGAAGAAVDYSLASSLKAKLQAAADAGALAGARELTLGTTGVSYAADVAANVSKAQLKSGEQSSGSAAVNAKLTQDRAGVEVQISQSASAYFSRILSAKPASVSATAIAKITSNPQKSVFWASTKRQNTQSTWIQIPV